jgi:hypothetical protein
VLAIYMIYKKRSKHDCYTRNFLYSVHMTRCSVGVANMPGMQGHGPTCQLTYCSVSRNLKCTSTCLVVCHKRIGLSEIDQTKCCF